MSGGGLGGRGLWRRSRQQRPGCGAGRAAERGARISRRVELLSIPESASAAKVSVPGARTLWHAARRRLLRRAAWTLLRICVQEAQAGPGFAVCEPGHRPSARPHEGGPPRAETGPRTGRRRACVQSREREWLRTQGAESLTDFHVSLCSCHLSRNVLDLPEDPGAVDVEDGVPPPRAAPPLLRRVVLNRFHDLDHSPTMGCRSAA